MIKIEGLQYNNFLNLISFRIFQLYFDYFLSFFSEFYEINKSIIIKKKKKYFQTEKIKKKYKN
jgi:hypothetical protein